MIRAWVDRLLDLSLWLVLAVMTLVVGTNVFCRFVLNASLHWGDEVAQILLAWLTFLGAATAVRDGGHYRLHFLSRILFGRRAFALKVVRDTVSLSAIVVLLYYSSSVAVRIREWTMPATEISRALVYAACPVGCALMLWYALQRLWGDLSSKSRQETDQ